MIVQLSERKRNWCVISNPCWVQARPHRLGGFLFLCLVTQVIGTLKRFCDSGEKDVAVSLGLSCPLRLTFLSVYFALWLLCVFCLSEALFVWDLCKYLNQIFGWFGSVCVNKWGIESLLVEQQLMWYVQNVFASFNYWFIHGIIRKTEFIISSLSCHCMSCHSFFRDAQKGTFELKNCPVALFEGWNVWLQFIGSATSILHNFFFYVPMKNKRWGCDLRFCLRLWIRGDMFVCIHK